MKRDYPCELIKDLIPLYIEGDVSPASKRLISEHLEQCESCKGIVKEYGESKEVISVEDFKESLPSVDTFKSFFKRLKLIVVFALAFLLVSGTIIGGIGYYTGKRSGGINQRLLHAKDLQDVNQFYYEKTPGFKRANEEERNVAYVNKQVEIPSGKGILSIDEVWYTTNEVYVFYHVEGEIPTNTHGKLSEGGEHDYLPYGKNISPGEGILYKDDFYSRITFGANNIKRSPTDGTTRKLDFTMLLGYDGKNEWIEVPTIELTVPFDANKEKEYAFVLDGKVDTGEYGELVFQELKIGPQKSKLRFQYNNSQGFAIQHLAGIIITDIGEEKEIFFPSLTKEDPSIYEVEFDTFDTIPQTLTINLKGLALVTTKELNFQIPVGHFHGIAKALEEEVEKKIGDVRDTQVFLEKLYYDDRGLDFTLLQKGNIPQSSMINRASTSMIHTVYEQERMREIMNKEFRYPNVISVINDKGVEAKDSDFGSRGSGPGERIGMFINKQYIDASDTLYIKLQNVTYKAIGDWKGNVFVKE